MATQSSSSEININIESNTFHQRVQKRGRTQARTPIQTVPVQTVPVRRRSRIPSDPFDHSRYPQQPTNPYFGQPPPTICTNPYFDQPPPTIYLNRPSYIAPPLPPPVPPPSCPPPLQYFSYNENTGELYQFFHNKWIIIGTQDTQEIDPRGLHETQGPQDREAARGLHETQGTQGRDTLSRREGECCGNFNNKRSVTLFQSTFLFLTFLVILFLSAGCNYITTY